MIHIIHKQAIAGHFTKAPLLRLALMAGLGSSLAGCVTVDAPDKPIVIELNINIKQEVVYRLDRAADKLITENKGIF
jgi:YnbE-like lipoprotein